jgi:FkbM family methyltransferase
MTFLDVGANWGYFTLLAAHLVQAEGRVVSLEPDPRLFSILQKNVHRNALDHVIPLQVAAADAAGTLTLSGYAEGSENRGIGRVVSGQPIGPAFEVKAESLDAVIGRLAIEHIDLLKMDIEGAEGMALAGLRRALSDKRVDRVLLELHPWAFAEQGLSTEQVLGHLLKAGYRGWVIDHSREATRRACYSGRLDPESLLRPFNPSADLDAWPHLLWAAAGLAPL